MNMVLMTLKHKSEMDQNSSGSSGQLIFRTQQNKRKHKDSISSGGTLWYNGQNRLLPAFRSAHKVLVTSAYEEWHFTWSGTIQ